jgi:hypothetical protein
MQQAVCRLIVRDFEVLGIPADLGAGDQVDAFTQAILNMAKKRGRSIVGEAAG